MFEGPIINSAIRNADGALLSSKNTPQSEPGAYGPLHRNIQAEQNKHKHQ